MKKLNMMMVALLVMTVSAMAQKNFYVPNIDDLSTVQGCHQHDADAVKCAKYYLKNNVDAPRMKEASKYYMQWIAQSDEIMLSIGEPAHTAVSHCQEALGAYLAACVIYNQEKKVKDLTFNMHQFAMLKMLEFYQKNKDYMDDNTDIDVYVDAKKNGSLKRLLQKEYDETMKQIDEANGQREL